MSEGRFDLAVAMERLSGKAKTLALSDRDIAIEVRKLAAAIDEHCDSQRRPSPAESEATE